MTKKKLKVLIILLAVLTVFTSVTAIRGFIKAKKYQKFDTVSSQVVAVDEVRTEISSHKRETSKTNAYYFYVHAKQNVEVQYTYQGTEYTTRLKHLVIEGEGKTYYSKKEAGAAAAELESQGYAVGDTIEVYTNGPEAMSVTETEMSGGAFNLVLILVINLVMLGVLAFMLRWYYRMKAE